MDIGLTMSTHGLLLRDDRDFFLQRLDAGEMRPVELAVHAERLGFHSVWFSDHVLMGRTASTHHTANESGTRAYPDRPVMLDGDAEGLSRALAEDGFEVRPTATEPGVVAEKHDVTDRAWSESEMKKLCDLANRFGAEYDGWEASMVRQGKQD